MVMSIGCGTQQKPSTNEMSMTRQLLSNDSVTARLVRAWWLALLFWLGQCCSRSVTGAFGSGLVSESDLLSAFCHYRCRALANEEQENGSKTPVGISEHPHWCGNATLSSPTLPDFRAKKGLICSWAQPLNRALRFIWGTGFCECSTAMNVRWAPFECYYLAERWGYSDVVEWFPAHICASRYMPMCSDSQCPLFSGIPKDCGEHPGNCGCGGYSEVGEALRCLW